jgi:hypothetical protein
MVDDVDTDDPFERAARKEMAAQAAMRARTDFARGLGMAATQTAAIAAGWLVLLALHGYIAGTGGLIFRVHLVLWGLWAAMTVVVGVQTILFRGMFRNGATRRD